MDPDRDAHVHSLKLALRILARRPLLLAAVVIASLVASVAEGLGLGTILALTLGDSPEASQGGLTRLFAFFGPLAGNDVVSRIRLAAIILFVAMLVRGIFYYTSRVLATWMEASVVHDLRSRIFSQLLALDIGHVHDQPMGKLFTTLIAYADDAGVMLRDASRSIVDLCTIVVYVAVLMLVSWQITTVTLLLLATLTLVIRWGFGRRLARSGAQVSLALAEVESIGLEGLGGLELIHLYGREQDMAERFRRASESHRRELFRKGLLVNLSRPIFMTANALALSLLILGATMMFPAQAQQWGSYAVLLLAIAFRLMSPAAALSDAHNVVETLAPSLDEILRFLERTDRADVRSGPTRFVGLSSNIRLVNVGFRYQPTAPEILRGVSFEIPKGRVVALMGATGHGKTTIVKLIARLHDCSSGEILVDGVDIRTLQLPSWRSKVAVVSQESFLFHDTVLANLRFVRPGATDAEIREAAAAAGADDFIARLPQSYETVVGHRGARLSGGQRQLVALARAILVEPHVLILDEASSQLDVQSELHIRRVINEMRNRCAVLIVGHRLTTVRGADEIVILHEGVVIERGTPEELVTREGAYARIVAQHAAPSTGALSAIDV